MLIKFFVLLLLRKYLDMSKKIPSYGELFKDNFFTYKILSHSKKQISKVEISKIN